MIIPLSHYNQTSTATISVQVLDGSLPNFELGVLGGDNWWPGTFSTRTMLPYTLSIIVMLDAEESIDEV